MISLQELRNIPRLSEFRFDIELENYEGEKEELLAALVSSVSERSDSVTFKMYIPEGASTGYIASLLTTLQGITSITISHNRNDNTTAFKTLHRVISFNGWQIDGDCSKTEFKPLSVSYSTEVSFPIMQPVEGLNEWLKEQGENK
jgi:hypothetical protein